MLCSCKHTPIFRIQNCFGGFRKIFSPCRFEVLRFVFPKGRPLRFCMSTIAQGRRSSLPTSRKSEPVMGGNDGMRPSRIERSSRIFEFVIDAIFATRQPFHSIAAQKVIPDRSRIAQDNLPAPSSERALCVGLRI